jgi:AraC-like DNA-binding protein
MQISYEKLVTDESSTFHYQEFVQPRFTSPFHLHDEFELIAIVESHGKLYAGNNVTNFNAGDVYLFAPGLPHCFYNTRAYEQAGIPAHAIGMFFKKDFLGSGFLDKTEAVKLARLFDNARFGIQVSSPTSSLIKRIRALKDSKNLQRLGDFLLLLHELSLKRHVRLLNGENLFPAADLGASRVIHDIYRYVAENFQREITFSMAAEVAHMQRAAFCRYFKRKTKKKFTEFVNETRIMHARKLLSETDKSVTEVAFDCGYENISYFNRQFRSLCGSTPSVFRVQMNSQLQEGR